MTWTLRDIPDLTGRTAVITGVTGGLGSHTAVALARAGADVIGTARSAGKAALVREFVAQHVPEGSFRTIDLDLADLSAVEASASALLADADSIDILINNAGIMVPPFIRSADGFELQMATNHVGHFAWTAHLWPALTSARIVSVSSLAHTFAPGLDLDVLTAAGTTRRYVRWLAYGQSKLANLLFMRELHRRISESGGAATSVAAHPGIARTELTRTGAAMGGSALVGRVQHAAGQLVMQPAATGALPSLQAATDPHLTGGEYLGPSGFRQLRGLPRFVGMSRIARDEQLARDLWAASEAATGLEFAP